MAARVNSRTKVAVGDLMIRYNVREGIDGNIGVYQSQYRVAKKTPKGAWIVPDHVYCDGTDIKKYHRALLHFVLDSSRKKFAYPAERDALESLIIRKKRLVEICEHRVKVAKIAIGIAEGMRDEM